MGLGHAADVDVHRERVVRLSRRHERLADQQRDPVAPREVRAIAATITPLDATLYVAPARYEAELARELGGDATPVVAGGRLYRAAGPARASAWAANVWLEPVELAFGSIAEAARALRGLGRNWVALPLALYRRTALITAQLPHVSARPLAFPAAPPTAPLGGWTLVAPDRILASARCTSPFPHGEPSFVEDRDGPPSRAYLKLWEALARAGAWPAAGERCVDLGASPGGWTWALDRLGARVIAIDKAPLAARVAASPRVEVRRCSAFAIDPASLGAIDWLVSDLIAYPDRLLPMIERWLAAHPRARYVVDIKLKGVADLAPLRAFAQRHGGTLVHLHHGKHELTWIRVT